jgi:transcriptional regulator with XRE-family HTH domain
LTPYGVAFTLRGMAGVNGNRLREFREGKRWSQERLAQEAGVSTATIYRIERGGPALRATKRVVADALSIPVETVFPEIQATTA